MLKPPERIFVASVGATLVAISALAHSVEPARRKIAVFEFELENTSPSGKAWAETTTGSATMAAITQSVKEAVSNSDRFSLVDTSSVDAPEVKSRSLRNCHGCDAVIAARLGADESLIGVISKAGNTEYYASVRLTDAVHHRVIFRKMSFAIGGEDAWAVGAKQVVDEALSHAFE